jgi:HlyD family secretion protein
VRAFVRRLLPTSVAVAVVAAIVYAFLPQPVRVDLGRVTRGPLQVTIEERGKTRIKDRYIVSSPLGGRLLRIELLPGDAVVAGETVLAMIEPGDPALLDPRARAEAEARVKAAEARLRQAGTSLDQTQAAMQFAEAELTRIRGLHQRTGTTQEALEDFSMRFRMRSEEYHGARFAQDIARFELEQARAALLRTTPRADRDRPPSSLVPAVATKGQGHSLNPSPLSPDPPPGTDDWLFPIRSPISGRVLKKFQESSTVVTAGTQLLQIGDPANLQVEVDVLSADGVRIASGDPVTLEQWGGEKPLLGRVRLVEPSAFTKVSSLGVEEQRVTVLIDFDDPPEKRRTLGDAYRVEAKIIIWESPDVLRVPIGALFRRDDDWAVFCVRSGRAVPQTLTLGHRNNLNAEVLNGLQENDEVIMHPSDQVVDGVRIVPR